MDQWKSADGLIYGPRSSIDGIALSGERDQSEDGVDRELLDTKLELSESRTEAKFTEMRGEMAGMRADLATFTATLREQIVTGQAEARADTAQLRTDMATLLGDSARTVGELRGELQGVRAVVDSKPGRLDIWGAALAGFALLIGVLAYAGDREAMGLSLADSRQEQLEVDALQNNMAANIDAKLDQLLKDSRSRVRTPPSTPNGVAD